MDHLPGRELAAVMFADMVGFTALMQANEQLAIEKRTRYRTVLEACHERFGGEVVQHYGDGALSIFHNAVDAVRCAVAIQKELSRPLVVPVRIGIHLGDVIIEPGGVIGDAVNIASRIESFGAAGAVLVSDSLHDQVKNQPQFDFVELGEFHLENVVRPFGIFAVASDGLVIPEVGKLDGKGKVAVPSVGRSGPGAPTARGLFRSSVLAAIGFVVVGLSVGVVWLSGMLTGDNTTVTTTVAASTSTVAVVDDVADTTVEELWSLTLDAPVVGMATMDGLAVIATGDGLVRGVAVTSGDELWRHKAARPAQLGVFADGGVVYYATAEGVSLLDPADGELIDGCGFSFRDQVQGVAVADGSVYFTVRSDGTVRRVPTDPIPDGPCHRPAAASSHTFLWLPPQSGPVVIGSEVLVGDTRTLTRLDAASLDLVGSYDLSVGTLAESYDARVVGLVGVELITRTASGVRTDAATYGADGEGALYAMVPGSGMARSDYTVEMVPVVSDLGVFLVDTGHTLRRLSHDLGRDLWNVDLAVTPTGLWLADNTVYVSLPDGTLVAIDAQSGSELHRLGVGTGIATAAFTEGAVIMATGEGRVTGFLEPSAPDPSLPRFEPIVKDPPPQPDAVVREFYAAVTAGDRKRVESLIAVDAAFGAAKEGGTWFSPDARDEFWANYDFFNTLNVALSVGTCEQEVVGESVMVDCEVTQSDTYLDALGAEISGSGRLVVESGLIHSFVGGPNFRGEVRISRANVGYRRGLTFTLESELLYDDFFDWAATTLADALEASCGTDVLELPTVECALFMLDHVDEYIAASE
ncbi:MAG: adenylate/guanylate cyclase domain-containing protein [Acidimicrobiia bacterium]|nr:adenylate/guanylate cyclase domain-containing protein [Acidimicrobiia bacterium]